MIFGVGRWSTHPSPEWARYFFPRLRPGFFILFFFFDKLSWVWQKWRTPKFQSSHFYQFNWYICLAVPHILCRYLSISHSICKPLFKPLVNGTFSLLLMMRSIRFLSMKIIKVLCENLAYNLHIKWAKAI